MQAHPSDMTGEELLLVRIFGDPGAQAAVDRELDRRALPGPPERHPAHRPRQHNTTETLSFRQVA